MKRWCKIQEIVFIERRVTCVFTCYLLTKKINKTLQKGRAQINYLLSKRYFLPFYKKRI